MQPSALARVTASTGAEVGADRRGGVTGRVVAVAVVLVVVIAALNFFVEVLWGAGSWTGVGWSSGVPAATPLIFLIGLTALGSLPVLRRFAFSRRELLALYAILLVCAPVLTHAVVVWMLVKNVAYSYSAQINTHWQTMFLPHVPIWWAPTDSAAVVDFFEGHARVPWAVWAMPLVAWGSFLVAIFVCSFSAMALLARQWVTNERLAFPFAQMPLELVSAGDRRGGEAAARLTATPAFWIGLGISLGINLLSGAAERFPSLPHITTFWYELIPWQRVGPLAGLGAITICLWPWMIGLAYLIPKDLSFSFWFFSLVRWGLTVAAIAAGATPDLPENWYYTTFPAPYHQGGGATLALLVWALWIGRRHLTRAARIAAGRGAGAERQEAATYRWALAGFAGSFAYMSWFFVLSGCRMSFSIALVALMMGYFIMWARLRAENGMSFLAFPTQIQDLVHLPFGTQVFRVPELITLTTMRWAYSPGFSASSEVFAGTSLEALKIADAARLNRRRLALAIAGAFLVSVIAGMWIFMVGVYHYGWFGLVVSRGGWLGPQSIADGGRIVNHLTGAEVLHPNGDALLAIGIGAAVTIVLGLLRLHFWWWPFHPVGYLAANSWGFHWWALPFFIGWGLKAVTIRYGGLRLYRALVPIAVGLIAGDLANMGVWAAARLLTQGRVQRQGQGGGLKVDSRELRRPVRAVTLNSQLSTINSQSPVPASPTGRGSESV